MWVLIWRSHEAEPDSFPRRIWRDDWFGDQFEVVTEAEFQEIERFCTRFSILVREAEDN